MKIDDSELYRPVFHMPRPVTKGGPGSGDLPGHEFRGNQWTGGVGGGGDESARQAKMSTVGGIEHSVPPRPAAEATASGRKGGIGESLKARSIKLADDVDAETREVLTITKIGDVLTPPQSEGVTAALDDLKGRAPGLYAMVQDVVKIGGMEADPKIGGVTTSDGIIMLNSKLSTDVAQAGKEPSTQAQQIAAALVKDRTSDAYTRELYKSIMIHEVGHVADMALQHGIAQELAVRTVAAATESVARGEDLPTAFAKVVGQVSNYAMSSPEEAAAEVFNAVYYDRPLPDAYEPVRASIKQLLKMPYKKS